MRLTHEFWFWAPLMDAPKDEVQTWINYFVWRDFEGCIRWVRLEKGHFSSA
jgi:hypothetical protein